MGDVEEGPACAPGGTVVKAANRSSSKIWVLVALLLAGAGVAAVVLLVEADGKEAPKCAAFAAPANATSGCAETVLNGEACTVTCTDGYAGGPVTFTCGKDGSWDKAPDALACAVRESWARVPICIYLF